MARGGLLDRVRGLELDATTKGIPLAAGRLALGSVGERGWNVLAGDVPLPALVVRDAHLRENLRTIAAFARQAGVELAPHGKTTMCPQLWREQLTLGEAWGLTVATVQQAAVAAAAGVERVILANEVTDRAAVEQLARLRGEASGTRIWSLVDSPAAVDALVRWGGPLLVAGERLPVLLEVGYAGGRTGARSVEAARVVAAAVLRHPEVLELAGVECFEGLLARDTPDATVVAVDALLDAALALHAELRASGAYARSGEVLLTAGGSAYFDRVARAWGRASRGRPADGPRGRRADDRVGDGTHVVLRGGCYLTFDHGVYAVRMRELDARGGLALPGGAVSAAAALRPALELVAVVQACHDPGAAILGFGNRDAGLDLGYPVPLRQYRSGALLAALEPTEWAVVRANDQHAYLRCPEGADLAVGDVLTLGVSHPCTTFDRWDVVFRVDEAFTVVEALKTFF